MAYTRARGLQRAYDEGFELSDPTVLVKFRTENKASCRMAERYYQLFYDASGKLMNTRIEKEPTGLLCKHGRKYLHEIKSLSRFIN
ncbi:hypothetical protein PODOV006v2_p0002 [Vibrio phage 15E36.1]|uniref:Uncharacterized protein n=1 Tax=Vibrio phage 15E36.1 TaxID=2859290 RepID=A0AAE8C4R9_9CAUD|nr:hypothetical protein PODOV006v2_p0002 [Vibrio phage 15E36.1]